MGDSTDSPTASQNEVIRVGDVFDLGIRRVKVSGMPGGATVCRDHRGRVAVRNVETDRLSYLPEWRLRGNRRLSPTAAPLDALWQLAAEWNDRADVLECKQWDRRDDRADTLRLCANELVTSLSAVQPVDGRSSLPDSDPRAPSAGEQKTDLSTS